MKKIWVLRYNDGTADVWDEEKGPPSWPYVDAFAADDAIKELHSDYADLRARVARLEEALKEISALYWTDYPAPEEMREIARRALEEK